MPKTMGCRVFQNRAFLFALEAQFTQTILATDLKLTTSKDAVGLYPRAETSKALVNHIYLKLSHV